MEQKINYIVRECPPEACELSWAFEDDGLTERGGDWNYNLFVVSNDGWGRLSGFNIDEYKRVRKDAEDLIEGFGWADEKADDYDGKRITYKAVMEDNRIPYNPRKCHDLKEWAKSADNLDTDDIAAYLTITTGKKWNSIGVCGYCQGDYVEVVYCEDHYKEADAKYYGECWLGCAREYCVIDVENYEAPEDEDEEATYTETDSVGGYIVSDSQAWRDEDIKRLVCEWAGIPEEETVLELIESTSYHTTYHYRTA